MGRMGIGEFRDRLDEVTHGVEPVQLVDADGRVVGTYLPARRDPAQLRAAGESIRRWQEEMRAQGLEPEDWLGELGLDPYGAPLGREGDR